MKLCYIGLDYDTHVTNCDGVSHTMSVYEGYGLLHGILRLAGRDLAEYVTKILTERGCSFTATAEKEIVPDAIEKPSYFCLDYDTELKSIAPGGNIISAGAGRFHCVDILF